MVNSRLEDIRQVRLEKLEKIRQTGINPFPSKYSRVRTSISQARQKQGDNLSIAGRLMRLREHGNITFADLKDTSGTIQLMFQKKNLAESFSFLKFIDVGDFLGATGQITTTQAGEISLSVEAFELLSKTLRPLPDDWHGLKDEEGRYRQRYLDLLLNEDLTDLFRKKSLFWQSMRKFLQDKGFTEVETPVLENTAGGADATPFITHHEALDIDLYLRISMGELWQKRLMVGGFEKTFEIGRQFRNEGLSREHLQDYTQMEFYWAYADYQQGMELVEEMYKYICQATFNTLQFNINGYDISLSKPWGKINYADAIKNSVGLDILEASETQLRTKLGALNIPFAKSDNRGRLIDHLWKQVRREIVGPVFLTGHPVEVSPLAKRSSVDSRLVERYQVIIAGSELGNGYSELNDPVDQAERFKTQEKYREQGDKEAQMNDADFVTALEYGMPPVTGFGVSERLFSFLMDKPIRECVLFPLLRPIGAPVKIKTVISSDTDYRIYPDVKAMFPGVTFAYVLIHDVDIKKENSELQQKKQQLEQKLSGLTIEESQAFIPIKTYREMFKATGVDYHSRRPSPEALLRRIIQGKGLYNINTAVDAYNLAVLETHVGLGGFDYSKISAPVVMRFSQKGEIMHLLGDDLPTKVDEGEIVYADQEKLLTLDLNYRDIDKTKITTKTRDVILFADGGPGLDPEEVVSALQLGANYITQYCGGESGEVVLVS